MQEIVPKIVKKDILNMCWQLELPEEVDIVSIASNVTAKDSDVCSIFGGKDTNLMEESNLLEFNQVFSDLKLKSTKWLTV